jgi:HSP20 family protein
MTLVRWRPFRDFSTLQDEMNRMMDRFTSPDIFNESELMYSSNWHFNVDIAENKDEFVVTAELPGLKKDDVHISFKEGALVIEGERKEEKEEKDVNYHRTERRYGNFCRTFNLGNRVKVDAIDAAYKDGVLKIRLPKVEEVKPKEIPVKIS